MGTKDSSKQKQNHSYLFSASIDKLCFYEMSYEIFIIFVCNKFKCYNYYLKYLQKEKKKTNILTDRMMTVNKGFSL